MEVWSGLSYDAILAMPSTRRQRLMNMKVDLEKRRAEKNK
jgi:hypothetical protein